MHSALLNILMVLLSFPGLISTVLSTPIAPELSTSDVSKRQLDVTVNNLCMNTQVPGRCYLGTFNNLNGMDLYAFDENCILIGWVNDIPYGPVYGMDSQLPYVIVLDTSAMSMHYGGSYYDNPQCFPNEIQTGYQGTTCQFWFWC